MWSLFPSGSTTVMLRSRGSPRSGVPALGCPSGETPRTSCRRRVPSSTFSGLVSDLSIPARCRPRFGNQSSSHTRVHRTQWSYASNWKSGLNASRPLVLHLNRSRMTCWARLAAAEHCTHTRFRRSTWLPHLPRSMRWRQPVPGRRSNHLQNRRSYLSSQHPSSECSYACSFSS